MIVHKITVGFVTQVWDTATGECLNQAFTCGDEVMWETQSGEVVDPSDIQWPEDEPYQAYEMTVTQ